MSLKELKSETVNFVENHWKELFIGLSMFQIGLVTGLNVNKGLTCNDCTLYINGSSSEISRRN